MMGRSGRSRPDRGAGRYYGCGSGQGSEQPVGGPPHPAVSTHAPPASVHAAPHSLMPPTPTPRPQWLSPSVVTKQKHVPDKSASQTDSKMGSVHVFFPAQKGGGTGV